MSASTDQSRAASDVRLKRTGIAGIALGALALLACELPFIFAFLGLSALGAGASLRLPPEVEIAGIVAAAMGAVLLAWLMLRRILRKRRQVET